MTGRSPRKHLSILTAALLAVAVYPAIPVLAQNKAASGTTMADKSQAVLNQLGSRGAKITMTNRAQVMRRAGGLASRMGGGVPACGDNGCICTGSECLDVIDSNKCDADTWHCVPSDDGPVCVCEQE